MKLEKYLKGQAFYYVDDCFSCEEKNVEYLFFLESPHIDEIKEEKQVPLAGNSGRAVAKFLFGEDEEQPFGEIVKKQEREYKIGIINISNVPLQNIDTIPKKIFPKELEKIRESKQINDSLYQIFKSKMDTYQFAGIKKIIVCGEFASTYFDEYNKTKGWDSSIILKVPHPSRGQWNFIEKNKGNLEKLKKIFKDNQ